MKRPLPALAGSREADVRRWLREVLEATSMTPTALAIQAGVAPSTLCRFLSANPGEVSTPTTKTLAKVEEAVKREFRKLGRKKDDDTEPEPIITKMEVIAVSEVDVRSPHQKVAEWGFPASWFERHIRAKRDEVQMLTVEDRTHEPKLHQGDVVMIDTSVKLPSPPGIFAVEEGESIVFKHLEIVPGTNRMRITSLGEGGASYDVPIGTITIVGRVKAMVVMM